MGQASNNILISLALIPAFFCCYRFLIRIVPKLQVSYLAKNNWQWEWTVAIDGIDVFFYFLGHLSH
jgi:hypothetical protein